ncbi:MAG: ATP-binding protein [bacterium]|nr:ATP-binding protein [bacterium]
MIQGIWKNFISSGIQEMNDITRIRKIKYINSFSLVGMVSFIIFSVVHIHSGNLAYGLAELIFAFASALNLISLRVNKMQSVDSSASYVLALMCVVLIFLLITGGIENTGIFWYSTFPALAFFLKGKRAGIFWICIIATCTTTIIFFQQLELLSIPYNLVTIRQLIASFIVISILIYFYEHINETDQETLNKEKTIVLDQSSLQQTILNNLPVGVLVYAPTGEVIVANNHATSILGDKIVQSNYLTQNIFCKENGAPYPPDLLPIALTLKEKIISFADDMTVNFGVPGKRPTVIRMYSAPVQNEKGELLYVVAVLEDITHEKEIDYAKTDFITIASHQLRTPLTAIKWFTEMLLQGDIGELKNEQRSCIQNILDSNTRMVELLNAMLNISALDAGKMVFKRAPVDIRELIDQTTIEMKPKIDNKKQTLILSIHDSLPLIYSDKNSLYQVYTNLMDNAIKYTPEGGEITLFVSKRDNEIVTQITDTGLGIPDVQQNKVFMRFFRGENIKNIETDGSGLSLYLIKSIVEALSGKIWFKSQENKGTTFWFTLPIDNQPHP